MISNKLHSIVISAAFLCLGAAPLFGQAVFSVGSTAAAVADIGVTELTGQIVLTVSSGTTVPAPLTITYSAQITNNAASEITITGTGGLGGVAGAPILLAASNAIIINVPTGGMAGDYIRIQGVRVSVAGQNFTGVTATVQALSSSGNGIVVGQNTVVVAGQVLKPLLMDLSQAPPLSFTFGATVDVSSFIIKEGFSSAFSSSIGQFGQTVPTRIRITPFPSIPAGIQVTFPASVSSTQTGAILATTSGQSETVPRADGSTEVIYEFSEAPSSSLEVESFTVPVSMTIDAAAAMGIINFQATLIPIGLATPNTAFPSTDIPRYVERKVPDETELSIGTIELAFPFRAQAAATYTGIALTNPTGFRVNATFTAYGADGSVITGAGINNPVVLTLPRNGQVAKLTKDIFGAGFSASTAGTIRVQGKSPQVAGFYLLGDLQGPRLDGAIGDLNSVQGWVWPVVFRRIPAPFTTFEIFNPGTVQANAVLTLFDAGGRIVKTASQSIAVSGTVNREFGELFPGVDLNSFSGGYIKGQSDVGVVVRETFGNSRDSNVVPGQIPIQRTAFYLPHFASGGGYTSELNLVNTDPSMKADIAVTLLDNNGLPLGSSVNLSILPGTQFIQTVASLFPALGGGLTTGSIRLDVKPSTFGWFVITPYIAGTLRFSAADGSGSSTLPLMIPPASDFVYSHVAENAGFYTGVAILNTDPLAAASVHLEVFSENGLSIGSFTTTLQPGQRLAKLLDQMVPSSAGQLGGYIRIQSSTPVTSFSLFGSIDGLSVSAIPAQRIGN